MYALDVIIEDILKNKTRYHVRVEMKHKNKQSPFSLHGRAIFFIFLQKI